VDYEEENNEDTPSLSPPHLSDDDCMSTMTYLFLCYGYKSLRRTGIALFRRKTIAIAVCFS